ncbi:hypothetical protein A2955_03345 [Candidatus Woesebacteria bacterium RIFCSPLOWO2_01_FULL_37_19]|uniref:3-deoxy-D-manno-octulosonic acid transferase n=2 Tax=Candidatus Woeseibacteriota TaxID=1752722 RepID=A0A1F8BBI8_9BACT|nr:MAG: hypothetical protein A2771_02925 [Candidatus Woesebacteria bacterium RIFCSPHIGHO2_01_FULL_38_26b]OGM61300.1 MAG: hypothetical protein A2955_03345 [Candidatus Woesebacteria bacterium RIFCSPLOWO2_01_FULL_37_19]
MKVMFLDESGDHSLEKDKIDKSYPMFVLCGCVFDLDDYIASTEPVVNNFKTKYFKTTKVILRSYDIRKQKKEFSFLVDYKTRLVFMDDLTNLVSSLKFTIIAAAINKVKLISRYSKPENPYHLCFRFILERASMFLGRSKENILFRAESRETHNDRKLAEIYEHFRSKGNNFISPEEAQRKLVDLSFNQKTQNIAGHQIADLVAYPIGRWVLDSKKENKPFEVIKKKFHSKNGQFINYGLKIFP